MWGLFLAPVVLRLVLKSFGFSPYRSAILENKISNKMCQYDTQQPCSETLCVSCAYTVVRRNGYHCFNKL